MNILLTNDDGIDHPGLQTLLLTLSKKHNVFTMAPDRNRSGFGSAVTFLTEVKEKKLADNVFSLDGTPVDCVKNALEFHCPFEPDIVVSGINPGPNLGPVLLYSGTVGAAFEGRNLKYPPIAVSVASFEISDYSFASETVCTILDNMEKIRLKPSSILNLNVPDHKKFKNPEIKITKTYLDEYKGKRENFIDDLSCLEEGSISLSPISLEAISTENLKSLSNLFDES